MKRDAIKSIRGNVDFHGVSTWLNSFLSFPFLCNLESLEMK